MGRAQRNHYVAARALFAFLHGDERNPNERELLGALVLSDAIDDLRTVALITRKWAEAQTQAAREAKARGSMRGRRR